MVIGSVHAVATGSASSHEQSIRVAALRTPWLFLGFLVVEKAGPGHAPFYVTEFFAFDHLSYSEKLQPAFTQNRIH